MSPRTKEQLEQIRQASRSAIMRAALSLFGTKGYEATSIDAIAREAGVAKGLIYNYFRSKEELLQQVVLQGLQEFEQVLSSVRTIPEPTEQLRSIFELTVRFIRERQEFLRLYFSLILQPEVQRQLKEQIADFSLQLVEELERILRAAGFADPRMEAYKLGALLDGLGIDHMVMGEEQYPLREVADSMLEDLMARLKQQRERED